MNSISTILPTGYSYTPQASKSELGKEDFLLLMIQQLQNQDPLEPMKNEDFIAQLAQFNSLEQMQNLNATMESLGNLQILAQTASMVGRNVEATDTDSTTISGVVTQVDFKSGIATLVIKDENNVEHKVTIDKILSVS
jgi:flagellar basal-body rod modification protein FlgD